MQHNTVQRSTIFVTPNHFFDLRDVQGVHKVYGRYGDDSHILVVFYSGYKAILPANTLSESVDDTLNELYGLFKDSRTKD